MAHPGPGGPNIEQMFEDVPNGAFDSSRFVEVLTMPIYTTESNTAKARLPSTRLVKPGGQQSKSQGYIGMGSSKGSSGQTSAASRPHRQFSTTESQPVAGSNKKPSMVKSQHRKSLTSERPTDKRMTGATALALYGDKLSRHEREEIQGYSYVWFLGGEAAKRCPDPGERMEKAFDDDEHFYRVVTGDHVAYRYEVPDKPHLGKGTFGQVIKAYDHKEERWVALKLVRNEKVYLNQSKEELRILQMLRKQDTQGLYNVVTMFDFFMFRNHMVFAFELLGMNLYQVLKRNSYRGLPASKILPIARAVLKCLELLFNNRLIHCDIKPENIMLRRNGDLTSIKVGDFGSSCYIQQQKYHYIQSRYYRAPEVILGLRYGPAIDMWSFGCVIGELVTGAPLLVGDNEDDQLAAIREAIGEMPASLMNKAKNPGKGSGSRSRGRAGSRPVLGSVDTSEGLKDAVRKVLIWDPEVRPTPREMQAHPWIRSSSRAVTARPHQALTPDSASSSRNYMERHDSTGHKKHSSGGAKPTNARDVTSAGKRDSKDARDVRDARDARDVRERPHASSQKPPGPAEDARRKLPPSVRGSSRPT